MAKQRPQPKSKDHASPDQPLAPAEPAAGRTVTSGSHPRRSTYVEAVATYEKGMEALQRHDYNKALELFEGVLTSFPEERELHERVRLYLNVCKRHATPPATTPQTVQERLYASTLALNGGRYDEAIAHLRLVRDEDPDNDHALYMLASVLALREALDEAVPLLLRAIALNPDNRTLARHDPDLEPLREFDSVRAALEATGPPKGDRRKPLRRR